MLASRGGRLLLGAQADSRGKRQARIPDLEAVLDADDPDADWTERVRQGALASIPDAAQIEQLDVRCVQSFCRIKMTKPRDTEAGWFEVDKALVEVAPGEAIFGSEVEDGKTTAYLYFSGNDGPLPLGSDDAADDS